MHTCASRARRISLPLIIIPSSCYFFFLVPAGHALRGTGSVQSACTRAFAYEPALSYNFIVLKKKEKKKEEEKRNARFRSNKYVGCTRRTQPTRSAVPVLALMPRAFAAEFHVEIIPLFGNRRLSPSYFPKSGIRSIGRLAKSSRADFRDGIIGQAASGIFG